MSTSNPGGGDGAASVETLRERRRSARCSFLNDLRGLVPELTLQAEQDSGEAISCHWLARGPQSWGTKVIVSRKYSRVSRIVKIEAETHHP